MSDNEIYGMVRESMAGVRMRRPVEAIVAVGRRRRRRQVTAGLAVSGLAAGAALALGLSTAGGAGGTSVAARRPSSRARSTCGWPGSPSTARATAPFS